MAAASPDSSHMLDRPVWHSLCQAHAELSLGDHLARRFHPEVNAFVATADDSEDAARAMQALVGSDETLLALQVPEIRVPPGLALRNRDVGVQMVLTGVLPPRPEFGGIQALGPADAPDMVALAELTRPGPFRARTLEMGSFFGIREDGALLAMAGERFAFGDHTELSGVCSHPHARGRGLARQLSLHVLHRMVDRGRQPFLHAYKSNDAAVGLYRSLGFTVRAEVDVATLSGGPPEQ